LGLRPPRAAAGDGLLGADARARPGDLVGTIDDPDRGRPADLGRAGAATGVYHRRWDPPNPILPPGAEADERSPSPRPSARVAVGNRLLSRLRVHHEAVRGVVLRGAAGGELGAEDAAVAEGEATGDLSGAALGRGAAPATDHRVGGEAGAVPRRLRLPAE